jgi:hypothetical protein
MHVPSWRVGKKARNITSVLHGVSYSLFTQTRSHPCCLQWMSRGFLYYVQFWRGHRSLRNWKWTFQLTLIETPCRVMFSEGMWNSQTKISWRLISSFVFSLSLFFFLIHTIFSFVSWASVLFFARVSLLSNLQDYRFFSCLSVFFLHSLFCLHALLACLVGISGRWWATGLPSNILLSTRLKN